MLRRIQMILLLSGILAEWVKISVLDPGKLPPELTDKSFINGSLSMNTNSTRSGVSSSNEPNDQFQKKMGAIKMEEHVNSIYDVRKNTTIDDFIQSVMNNSQAGNNETNHSHPESSFFSSEVLKNIQNSFLYQKSSSNKVKIIFLENLKQKLYVYIRPYMELFWDNKERQARTDKGMGFPSMDGALMTISFLLFAVFLIKLVQQLIQQVQDKANAQAMLMTGATPVMTTPAGGRRRRDVPSDVYAAAQIFHFIEQFHAKDYT